MGESHAVNGQFVRLAGIAPHVRDGQLTPYCVVRDENLAENNPTWMTIHRDVALGIWDDIVIHDLLEAPSSTLYHLQPARSIYYAFLRSSIEILLNTRYDLQYPTLAAYQALLADFRRRLSQECVRAVEALGSTGRQRCVMLQEPGGVGIVNGPGGFWEYGLAPGFMEFAKRTLSWTLQFLSLRLCHYSEGGGEVSHLHGLRKCKCSLRSSDCRVPLLIFDRLSVGSRP